VKFIQWCVFNVANHRTRLLYFKCFYNQISATSTMSDLSTIHRLNIDVDDFICSVVRTAPSAAIGTSSVKKDRVEEA
jgi:hypothetical protein